MLSSVLVSNRAAHQIKKTRLEVLPDFYRYQLYKEIENVSQELDYGNKSDPVLPERDDELELYGTHTRQRENETNTDEPNIHEQKAEKGDVFSPYFGSL
ncbi:hypothetical protein JTB14_006044 [Gonioctena quinquepunctata]|nr:hypothetical protein JTB14_006044 [Gonioctena quinquepunctata]